MANAISKSDNAARIRDLLSAALRERVPISDDLDSIHNFIRPTHHQSPDGKVSYEELLVAQMVHKACAGNDKAITELLDRLAGKPAQVNENYNANFSYTDYLEQLNGEEDASGLKLAHSEDGRDVLDVLDVLGLK